DANKNLKLVKEIPNAHGDFDVNSVRWCPLEKYSHLLVSGGDDSNVKIWSFEDVMLQ
ncbi:UNVERIFIED_CONTAM: hypothetical protein HDU68_004375, partial [Siphonaria sp. JEL0065]